MSLRTGWKVVRWAEAGPARYGRPVFAPRYARAQVGPVYEPDAWTFPQRGCGPLCVFDSWAFADAHFRSLETYDPDAWELWSCTYVPARTKNVWVRFRDREDRPVTVRRTLGLLVDGTA